MELNTVRRSWWEEAGGPPHRYSGLSQRGIVRFSAMQDGKCPSHQLFLTSHNTTPTTTKLISCPLFTSQQNFYFFFSIYNLWS